MKTCSKCGCEKEESLFTKGRNICKVCKRVNAKEYYYKNIESCKKTQALYREKHRDAISTRMSEYNKQHKEIINKKSAIYFQQNKQQIIAQRKEYYHTNELAKLSKNLRNRTYNAFRLAGFNKTNNLAQLVGLSFEQLLDHLGPRLDKMCHLDHICPLSQAQTKEEMEKLNHYTNLRWLPASENLSKSDSRTTEGESLCQLLLGRPWIEPTLPQ